MKIEVDTYVGYQTYLFRQRPAAEKQYTGMF